MNRKNKLFFTPSIVTLCIGHVLSRLSLYHYGFIFRHNKACAFMSDIDDDVGQMEELYSTHVVDIGYGGRIIDA